MPDRMDDTERLDRLEGWLRDGWSVGSWALHQEATLFPPKLGKFSAPTLREAIDLAAEACDE